MIGVSLLDQLTATPSPDTPSDDRHAATLAATGVNHALHDGYTDLIYVLLPIWQSEFGLGYGMLALMRALYAGAMAGLQIPVGPACRAHRRQNRPRIRNRAVGARLWSRRAFGQRRGLCLALMLSGAGSSTQHPLASAAVARAYGAAARRPLGIYNFTGDLGKAAIPALLSFLLIIMPWRHALLVLALAGLAVAVYMAVSMPPVGKRAPRESGCDDDARPAKYGQRLHAAVRHRRSRHRRQDGPADIPAVSAPGKGRFTSDQRLCACLWFSSAAPQANSCAGGSASASACCERCC